MIHSPSETVGGHLGVVAPAQNPRPIKVHWKVIVRPIINGINDEKSPKKILLVHWAFVDLGDVILGKSI